MNKCNFFRLVFTLLLIVLFAGIMTAQRCTAARTTDFAVPTGTASTSNTRILFTVQYDLDYRKMKDREATYIAVVQFETTTTGRTKEGEKPAGTEFRGVATQIFRPATDGVDIVTKSIRTAEGVPVNRLIREGSGYRRNARVLIFRVSDTELSRCTER